MNKLTSRLLWAGVFAVTAGAADTRTWSQNTQTDFEKGQMKGLSLRSDGRLAPAPVIADIFDASVPYLWSLARDSKGNLYTAGASTGGSTVKLYRIDTAGKSAVWAELEGGEIHAVAVDREDRVYAGTSPDGKVYRVAAGGKAEVLYEPKVRYIWAMTFSPAGDLYLATGDRGEIHKVTPAGKGTVLARLEDANTRSLALDGKGNVIVGTEPSGLVVRISPAGETFVLHQTAKREVTAVAVGSDGRIYAAGVGNRTPVTTVPPPPPPLPVTAQQATAQPPMAQQQQQQAQRPPTAPPMMNLPVGPVAGGSELWRIDADGAPQKIWASATEVAYALAFDGAGRPVVGTGNKGHIYRVDSDSLSTLVAAIAPTQVTAFLAEPGGGLTAATANVGKIVSIGPREVAEGTIESDVYDAGGFSYWGRLLAEDKTAGGTITYETRSGNLDRPQKSWSPWTPLRDGVSASPAARFVQWRASLKGAAAELRGVDLAYRQKNLPPRIETVEGVPGNYKFPSLLTVSGINPTLTLPALGQRQRTTAATFDSAASGVTLTYQKGMAGARWLAQDPNGDTLTYRVEVKGVNEASWRLIKDKISERFVNWDAAAFADGEYAVRVTASDSASNPPAEALTAQAASESFLIDNTPPAILDLAAVAGGPGGSKVSLSFRARDQWSWIAKAEYTLNGVDWLILDPVNKLSDAKELRYDILIDRPQPGEVSIAVRVTDEFDNVVVERVLVR